MRNKLVSTAVGLLFAAFLSHGAWAQGSPAITRLWAPQDGLNLLGTPAVQPPSYNLSLAPAVEVDGQNMSVAFQGADDNGVRQGIFLYENGVITRVADRSESPSKDGDDTEFVFEPQGIALSSGDVYFGAKNRQEPGSAVLGGGVWSVPPVTQAIVEEDDLVSGFELSDQLDDSFFNYLDADGSDFVFRGHINGTMNSGFAIVAWRNGMLEGIAKQNVTSFPGGGLVKSVDYPAMDNGTIAFLASSTTGSSGSFAPYDAVLADSGTGFSKLYDTSTQAPQGGAFTGYNDVNIGNGSTVLYANGPGSGRGIYVDRGQGLEAIAQRFQSLPGASGTYYGFDTPVVDGDTVVFEGTANGTFLTGLYAWRDGTTIKILEPGDIIPASPGDPLENDPVELIVWGRNGLDGDTLALVARHDSGATALYVADLGPAFASPVIAPISFLLLLSP